MKKMSALCLLALIVAVSPAAADIMQHPIGLQIWSPDTWGTEVDGEMLTLTSPDEGAVVMLIVLKAREMDAAIDEMDRELTALVRDPVVSTQPQEIDVNGLSGITTDGYGQVDGAQLDWMCALLRHRSHVLMVLGFADSANFYRYEQILSEILGSIQPR